MESTDQPLSDAEADVSAEDLDPPPRPPTLSGVLSVALLALVLVFVLQFLLGMVLGVIAFSISSSPQAGEETLAGILGSTLGLTLTILATQSALLIAAWNGASRHPHSRLEQYGLRRPHVGPLGCLALVFGTVLLGMVGQLLAAPLLQYFSTGVTAVVESRGEMSLLTFAAFLPCVSLVPGFVEEILFRGYLQRRLLRRLRPFWAIGWSTVIFAILHLDLYQGVSVIPVGIWLGVIAWRTGSIWPAIICHVAFNAWVNAWAFVGQQGLVSTATYVDVSYTVLGLAVAGFLIGVVILRRLQPTPPAGPSVFDPPEGAEAIG